MWEETASLSERNCWKLLTGIDSNKELFSFNTVMRNLCSIIWSIDRVSSSAPKSQISHNELTIWIIYKISNSSNMIIRYKSINAWIDPNLIKRNRRFPSIFGFAHFHTLLLSIRKKGRVSSTLESRTQNKVDTPKTLSISNIPFLCCDSH